MFVFSTSLGNCLLSNYLAENISCYLICINIEYLVCLIIEIGVIFRVGK